MQNKIAGIGLLSVVAAFILPTFFYQTVGRGLGDVLFTYGGIGMIVFGIYGAVLLLKNRS